MRVLIVTALITAALGGLCVGAFVYGFNRGEIEGSGNVVSEDRPVTGVSSVSIDGPGRLVIAQGDAEGLTITTDDNILERIETDVRNGELEISYERSGVFTTLSRIRPSDETVFELTVKDLTEIRINGAADVEIDGFQGDRLEIRINGAGDGFLRDLRLDELVLDINGASTFDVAGTVDRQEITIDGSANYRAASLASREAVIEIDGSGDATVRVSDTLDVTIDGAGSVRYIGDPAITEEIDGAGDVRPATGDDSSDGATPAATPAASPSATRPVPTLRALSPIGRTPTPEPDEE